ncbi:hypothetical protein TNCV_3050501 [Trichonephila clavipes]|nr:hypothetical protein TNCV_3050501 [Trichonephila clavipes]
MAAYRSPLQRHVAGPVVRFLKKNGPRTNVAVMPHHTVTLASNNGTGKRHSVKICLSQCTQFFVLMPFKVKCASSVHSMRSGQSLSASYRNKNSFVQTLLWVTRLQHLDALEPIGKHEVPSARACGPLSSEYPTRALCLLRFLCVLQSLYGAL